MGTKPYKVLVSGDRDYKDRDRVYHILDVYRAKIGPDMHLITGGARGVDQLALDWAIDRRCDFSIYFARWEIFGNAAGPIRNRLMAKKKPRLVIAIHPNLDKSKGTRDMVKVAEQKKTKVKRFK